MKLKQQLLWVRIGSSKYTAKNWQKKMMKMKIKMMMKKKMMMVLKQKRGGLGLILQRPAVLQFAGIASGTFYPPAELFSKYHCRNVFAAQRASEEVIMAQGTVTTEHNKIRRWAEERRGIPATVKQTKSGSEPGVLRLDFEPRDEALEPVSWEDFFDKFEKEGLAFLYQERTDDGSVSRFHKFVNRS